MTGLAVERAAPGDVAAIMAIERLPGYESLVGRWDEDRHRVALADPAHALFVARRGRGVAGFAILRGWRAPERNTLLQRIAVAEPGRGDGRALLLAVMDRVFEETEAHRFHLGLFPHNARARRAYEAAGFVAEGISRGSAYLGGVHHDELIMAILRPDWVARRA